MNRRTLVYLFMGLTMVSLVFGALPLTAAETSNAPVGVTETPTSAPTNTPIPNTPIPNTLIPATTNTPTAPAVVGLPNTGGAAPQGGVAAWILVLVALVVGSLGALAFGLRMRTHRPTLQ